MANWKTTLIGILVIIATVAKALGELLAGQPVDPAVAGTGLLTGGGLLLAKDHDKH